MKKLEIIRTICFALCSFVCVEMQCQTSENEDTFNNGLQTNPVVGVQSPNAIRDFVYGKWGQQNNGNIVVEGSVYLFDKWNTKGVIHTQNQKKYKISDININIRDNRLEAKFRGNSKDSIFVFNNDKINKVFINNKEFVKKTLTLKNVTTEFFVEKLKNTGKIKIYKLYYVFFKEGEFDRLTQKKIREDRYVNSERFFIEKEDAILKPVKLKKSEVLNVFEDKKKRLKDYIKKNKLKVKDEKDFIKLVKYYNTL